jgi:peptidoglycan/LPS O-acetylase OafA/YrhL
VNRNFPALRGIAILLVVINHSITLGLQFARNQGVGVPQWQKSLLIPIKELGIFAVPLFLFLAGSYFAYAAQGKNLKAMYRLIPNNLLHIATPYLIWSLVFYVVVFFLFGEQDSLVGYAKSLIVGYPNNFVPLLFFFTCFAPFLITLTKKFPLLIFLAFFAYQAFLVILLRPDIFGSILPEWARFFAPPIIRLPLALWGVFYPLGVILGLRYEWFKQTLSNKTNVFILIVLTLVLFSLAVSTQLSIISLPLIEIIVPLFGLIWLTNVKREQTPFVRFFERLGKRSYGIYLTNLIIINLIFFTVVQIGTKQLLAIQPLVVTVIAAITIFLPLLFMEWVEKNRGRTMYRLVFG